MAASIEQKNKAALYRGSPCLCHFAFFVEKIKSFFEKGIDKDKALWYNTTVEQLMIK